MYGKYLMDNNRVNTLNLYIDSASKIFNISFKISMFIGGLCLLIYCVRIGYFPSGVGLGDGFIFLMLAACFGLIYIVFFLGLLGVGIWFYPLLCGIQNLIIILGSLNNNKNTHCGPSKKIKFIKPNSISSSLGVIGILFIIVLGKSDFSVIMNLIICSIGLASFVAIFQTLSGMAKEHHKTLSSPIEKNSAISKQNLKEKIIEIKKGQFIILVVVILFPLLWSGASGTLLESVMKITGIRKEASIIYLVQPFSELIPIKLLDKKSTKLGSNMKGFKDILILFKGLGEKTVIGFEVKGKPQMMVIPNESIVVY